MSFRVSFRPARTNTASQASAAVQALSANDAARRCVILSAREANLPRLTVPTFANVLAWHRAVELFSFNHSEVPLPPLKDLVDPVVHKVVQRRFPSTESDNDILSGLYHIVRPKEARDRIRILSGLTFTPDERPSAIPLSIQIESFIDDFSRLANCLGLDDTCLPKAFHDQVNGRLGNDLRDEVRALGGLGTLARLHPTPVAPTAPTSSPSASPPSHHVPAASAAEGSTLGSPATPGSGQSPVEGFPGPSILVSTTSVAAPALSFEAMSFTGAPAAAAPPGRDPGVPESSGEAGPREVIRDDGDADAASKHVVTRA